jgi:hypothetical protein
VSESIGSQHILYFEAGMAASKTKVSQIPFESYFAKADPTIAMAVAATSSPFTIEVRFQGGLSVRQMEAFKS